MIPCSSWNTLSVFLWKSEANSSDLSIIFDRFEIFSSICDLNVFIPSPITELVSGFLIIPPISFLRLDISSLIAPVLLVIDWIFFLSSSIWFVIPDEEIVLLETDLICSLTSSTLSATFIIIFELFLMESTLCVTVWINSSVFGDDFSESSIFLIFSCKLFVCSFNLDIIPVFAFASFNPENSLCVSSSIMFICFDCFWIWFIVEPNVSIIFFIDTRIFWLSAKILVINLISFDRVFVESETDATFFNNWLLLGSFFRLGFFFTLFAVFFVLFFTAMYY